MSTLYDKTGLTEDQAVEEITRLRAALRRLRDCPDVQMDSTEPETDAAVIEAGIALGELKPSAVIK